MKKIILITIILFSLLLAGCSKTEPVTCPEIDTPEKGFFPAKGDELYKLKTGKVAPGDGYKIAPSEKQSNIFYENDVYCDKGKDAGENINYIYCEQLIIQKPITTEEGDIMDEGLMGVEFIFDKKGKLIETNCYK